MTILSKNGINHTDVQRPKNTDKQQESTQAINVPCSLLPKIYALINNQDQLTETSTADIDITRTLPLFQNRVAAGSPTIADNAIEEHIDLLSYIIKNPLATFIVRAEGDSMLNAGIFHHDLLIVDKSIDPKSGHVVIAVIDGELTVKRLEIKDKCITLCPENPDYEPIPITPTCTFSISGVVTYVIHSLT